jgi:hypothetical protein
VESELKSLNENVEIIDCDVRAIPDSINVDSVRWTAVSPAC